MRLLISLILLFTFSPYVGALTSLDRAELSFPNSLQDSNPGFESGTVKWTASPAITINSTAGDQFITGSKQFAIWDSNSAGQEVCSELKKVPESGNCAVSLTYKVPSGTATHKIVAKDGSKDLSVEDVVSSTAAWRHDVEFPCASAASNQARVCLRSVASNEPAIQLDQGYAGEARNVAQCGVDTPWVSYTPSLTTSGGGAITLNATSKTDPFGKWRQVGDSIEIEVGFKNGSGGAATGTAGTMQFSTPSGASIDSSKAVSTSAFAFTVGTGNVYPLSSNFSPSSAVLYNGGILQLIKAGTASSFQVSDIVAGFEVRMRAKYPVVGWEASQCVTPNQQRAPKITHYLSGSGTHTWSNGVTHATIEIIGGGGGGGGAGTSSTAGGAGGQSSFDGVNAPGGTGGGNGTGGGAGAPGAATAVPCTTNETFMCRGGARGAAGTVTDSSASALHAPGGHGGASRYGGAGLGLYESTGASAQANTGSGGAGGAGDAATYYAGAGGTAGADITWHRIAPSGSASYTVGAAGAAGTGTRNGGAGGSGYIKVTEHFGYTTAILANSVSTPRQNGDRQCHMYVQNTGTPTILRSNGCVPTGTSAITDHAAGETTVTWGSGVFSASPDSCTGNAVAGNQYVRIQSLSQTAIRIHTPVSTTGTNADADFTLSCSGPR